MFIGDYEVDFGLMCGFWVGRIVGSLLIWMNRMEPQIYLINESCSFFFWMEMIF